MTGLPKIAIISFSNLKNDPRVKRQIKYLSKSYQVLAIGWANPEIEHVDFIDISYRLNKLHLIFNMLLTTALL